MLRVSFDIAEVLRFLPDHTNAVSLPFAFPAGCTGLEMGCVRPADTADANINEAIFFVSFSGHSAVRWSAAGNPMDRARPEIQISVRCSRS